MDVKTEKSNLIFKAKDGKAYRVNDIVLAVATSMSKPNYVQPICFFLELAFRDDHELLINAYNHFFIDHPSDLTKSVPFMSKWVEGDENEEDCKWQEKYGEGIKV